LDWLVCTRSREKVKYDGPVRLAEAEESEAEVLVARRLVDVFGASGSCTD
jgi:hypothetical protein